MTPYPLLERLETEEGIATAGLPEVLPNGIKGRSGPGTVFGSVLEIVSKKLLDFRRGGGGGGGGIRKGICPEGGEMLADFLEGSSGLGRLGRRGSGVEGDATSRRWRGPEALLDVAEVGGNGGLGFGLGLRLRLGFVGARGRRRERRRGGGRGGEEAERGDGGVVVAMGFELQV